MTLGFWALSAWLTEFVLEASGAYLAFRKRLRILAFMLAWRAFMDAATFTIWKLNLHPGYGYTFWAGLAVQYAILYALGVQLAAKMTQDFRPNTRRIYMTLAIACSVVSYVFVTTDLWEKKFFTAEALAGFLLIAVVGVGWIGRKKELEELWKMITAGVLISSLGNAFCAILSGISPKALSFYPLPAITALLVWNAAMIYRKREPMRLELPPKIEPTGVYREMSRRVQ